MTRNIFGNKRSESSNVNKKGASTTPNKVNNNNNNTNLLNIKVEGGFIKL